MGLLESHDSVLHAFLGQYYTLGMGSKTLPQSMIASSVAPQELLEYCSQILGKKVEWIAHPKGRKFQWLELAKRNAEHALLAHLASKQSQEQRFLRLQEILGLPQLPERIECFDISHSQGESTVASCVVFDAQGAVKSAYRRFNITSTEVGDDYAAMKEALTRRYARLKTEQTDLPDVVLIDGGKGQLSQAIQVMMELGITSIKLIAIAKGPTRKAGIEQLWMPEQLMPLTLDPHDLGFLLIQQIRDEAHRFAITGHRGRRDKARKTSQLESVPGIGPKKRQALLRHFGGWQQIRNAGVEEIAKVPGMSLSLAKLLKDRL